MNENGSDNGSSGTDLPDTSQYEESGSKSRIRKFSEKIRNELERAFLANNFITGAQKKVLAKRLSLTERQVSKWFVHRREKLRRLEKRATNINTTLQQHYISRTQQHQHQPTTPTYVTPSMPSITSHSAATSTATPNNYYQQQDNIMNNNENDDEDEENWFNDLQDPTQEDSTQFLTHNEADYYDEDDDDEDDYIDNTEYHSSSETNISDENHTEYQTTASSSSSNKRLSTSQLNMSHSSKRVCMDSMTDHLNSFKPSARRLFPPEVITHLETIFDSEKYLKDEQVHDIARVTNLSEKQIRSWFKQRRYRYNQENKQNGIDIEIKKYNNLSQPTVRELEKAFRKNNYVYGNDKKVLARRLNLTPVQLERWFYYRRKKLSNGSI